MLRRKTTTKPSNSRTYTCPPHYARCHSATFFLIHPFIKHHQFAVQKKITPSVSNKESEKERKKRIRLHTERIRESSNNNGFIDCTENPSFQLLEGFPSIPPFSSLPFQSLSGLLRFCLQELWGIYIYIYPYTHVIMYKLEIFYWIYLVSFGFVS